MERRILASHEGEDPFEASRIPGDRLAGKAGNMLRGLQSCKNIASRALERYMATPIWLNRLVKGLMSVLGASVLFAEGALKTAIATPF